MRAIVLVILGGLLIWQVAARSVVAYLATAAPETALMLEADDAGALLTLADNSIPSLGLDRKEDGATASPSNPERAAPAETSQETNQRLRGWAGLGKSAEKGRRTEEGASFPKPASGSAANDGRKREQVRDWTRLALANDPLNAHALRILGQLADADGDDAQATKLMRAAAQRSIRESLAVYSLMRKSYETGDYTTAIHCADALLRTRSTTMPLVMPTLVQMAQNKAASEELKKLIAGNPPWRPQFFELLPRSVTDARMPLDILLAVKDTQTPPTAPISSPIWLF